MTGTSPTKLVNALSVSELSDAGGFRSLMESLGGRSPKYAFFHSLDVSDTSKWQLADVCVWDGAGLFLRLIVAVEVRAASVGDSTAVVV